MIQPAAKVLADELRSSCRVLHSPIKRDFSTPGSPSQRELLSSGYSPRFRAADLHARQTPTPARPRPFPLPCTHLCPCFKPHSSRTIPANPHTAHLIPPLAAVCWLLAAASFFSLLLCCRSLRAFDRPPKRAPIHTHHQSHHPDPNSERLFVIPESKDLSVA